MWPAAKNIFSDFVNLVFPEYCLGCKGSLLQGEQMICSKCRANLPLFDNNEYNGEVLTSKFYGEIRPNAAYCLLKFHKQGITQSLLHQLKYGSQTDLGIVLGRLMGNQIKAKGTWDVVLPVPLHPAKKKLRGYNQSDFFAEGIAEFLECDLEVDVLKRIRKSETQTRKNRLQRWDNVEGIFDLNKPEVIENKHIILVDDVLTTGATAGACIHELIKAKPKSISLCFIAYAI